MPVPAPSLLIQDHGRSLGAGCPQRHVEGRFLPAGCATTAQLAFHFPLIVADGADPVPRPRDFKAQLPVDVHDGLRVLPNAADEVPEGRAPIVAHEVLHLMRPGHLRVGKPGLSGEWLHEIVADVMHAPILDEALESLVELAQLAEGDGPAGAALPGHRLRLAEPQLSEERALGLAQSRALGGQRAPVGRNQQEAEKAAGERREPGDVKVVHMRHRQDNESDRQQHAH